MLKYLVILLDNSSISFCHYDNKCTENNLISLDDLKEGIFFAMKENLMIQFVYPNYELPKDYKDVINSIDHSKIIPIGYSEKGDVIVINSLAEFNEHIIDCNLTYVLRTNKEILREDYQPLINVLRKASRLNLVFTDIETFTSEDYESYKKLLQFASNEIANLYESEKTPQLNILTDRIALNCMNNCNAGWENITLAPNGRFYICPAFYISDSYNIGDLKNGLNIKNPQLYKLSHAPLCRICDAYQCKRCIWLNHQTTCEVNTPSQEQCIVAHLERNESRNLLLNLQKRGIFLTLKNIEEISYIDPIEKLINI